MPHPITASAFLGFNSKLRKLLGLLEALRGIHDPLSTPDGLRASLDLLLRLAEFVGVDPSWTARVRTILENPRVFDIVLAVVRYLDGLVDGEHSARYLAENEASAAAAFDAAEFVDWFPLVLQIIALIRELRGLVQSP